MKSAPGRSEVPVLLADVAAGRRSLAGAVRVGKGERALGAVALDALAPAPSIA